MAVTEIPWGDGSGDKIYLTYSALEGDQTVLVSSDANMSESARTKNIVFSAQGVSSVTLSVTQEATVADLVVVTYNGTCITRNDVGIGYPYEVPSTYTVLAGMTMNGNQWFDTGVYLQGSDTVRLSYKVTKSCNVIGCYTTTSANDNYSLYLSTSSSAKYMRYGDGTYNSYVLTNKQYDVVITPTGTSGLQVDSTWTAKTFTSSTTCLIGTTSTGATSAKFTGDMYGVVEIEGKAYCIPVLRKSDNAVGYYDAINKRFLANQGSGNATAIYN